MPMNDLADHAPGHPDSAWCRYCSKPDGSLQEFEERFERMVQWEVKKKGRDRSSAEQSTREFMRAMPAWKDHPQLRTAP